MTKNDRRFTIHFTSTVKKLLRTCTVSKRLKEYLSIKSPCRLFSTTVQWFVYSTSLGSLARHTTLCALEVIFNTLKIALLQKFLLNFWDGEAPVEWNSIICFPYGPGNVLLHFLFLLSSVSCCSRTVSHCGYPRVLRVEWSNSETDRGGDGKNCK